MIAAFLCGLMYGWLGYRRWLTAHNRRVLRATLPPSDDDPAHYGKGWGPDPYSGYQPTRYPSSGTQM